LRILRVVHLSKPIRILSETYGTSYDQEEYILAKSVLLLLWIH
jgi:hypothetical protein